MGGALAGVALAHQGLTGVKLVWSAGAAECGHIISFGMGAGNGAGRYGVYGHP